MRKLSISVNHLMVFILLLYMIIMSAAPDTISESVCLNRIASPEMGTTVYDTLLTRCGGFSEDRPFSSASVFLESSSSRIDDIYISDAGLFSKLPEIIRNNSRRKFQGSESLKKVISISAIPVTAAIVVLLLLKYCIHYVGQVQQKLSVIIYIHNQDGRK